MTSASRPSARQRRLLVAGALVPITLIASMLGATSASAAGSTETTKAGLIAAVQSASNGYVVTLGNDLLGDGGSSDVLTVPNNRSVTVNLNGYTLDLDRIVVGSVSNLFIADNSGSGSEVSLGGAASPSGQQVVTGAVISANARLEVESDVHLTSFGSSGRAGVGTVAGSDNNAMFIVDDGARIDSTGGSHGSGIGGGESAAPISTISITGATVHATGGQGAAGIGGGFGGTGTGSSVSIEDSDVTVGGGSAIGGGDGAASTFGTLANTATAGHASTLRIASGSTLTVPAGQSMTNGGDLVVTGTLTGAGSIDNTGGTIRQAPGGVIDDEHLTVTGRNHAVTFAPGAGTVTAPPTKHVYATTFANAGLDLAAYTGTSASKSLVGWSGTRSGSPVAHVTNADLLAALSTGGGESDPVPLTAAYETTIAFTGTTLPNAAIDQPYDRRVPVTGDATAFTVAPDPATGLPAGTTPSFPPGLSLAAKTGTLSGRPTAGGHYSFLVTATSPHQHVSQALTIDIAAAPVIATAALPDGTAGTAYSAPILATTAEGSIGYAVTGGVLPGGLQLGPTTGVLSGTPTSSGTFTFTVSATNDFGSVERTLSLTVAAATAIVSGGGGGGIGGGTGGGGSGSGSGDSTPSGTSTGVLGPAPADRRTSGGGSPAPAAVAPVLPILATTTVKLGHPLALSVAASSTVPVRYSVPAKDLPAGISLDRAAGLLFGAPRVPGRYVLHITATNSAGSTSRAYAVVVPEVTRLVTGSASAITPRSGTRMTVTIRGLQAGERWRIALNGHQVQTGIAKFGGTVKRLVRLPARAKDTKHLIRVSGDRRITDPSTTATHQLTITAVTAKKELKLTRKGSTLTVRGLAAKERVTVKRGAHVLATGRADALGVFVVQKHRLRHGTHTVVGSAKHRAGRLVVR
jgi:hypothetical protein